jgi:hypothetical protein
MSTVEIVRASLSNNDRAVEKAMVLLYACQTADEKATKTTRVTNGMGFTSSDARKGSYYARWVIGCRREDDEAQTAAKMRDYLTHGFREGINRRLSGNFLQDARHRSMKYAGQLLRISEAMRKPEGA